jgi:alpha-tubulin suppressor-like RCC1 family protein
LTFYFLNFLPSSWGRGDLGQLGYDSPASLGNEVGEMTNLLFISFRDNTLEMSSIAAGGYHTCSIFSNGSTFCWGSGTVGQLGQGSTADIGRLPGSMSSLPVIVFSTTQAATAVSCGHNHSYFFHHLLSRFTFLVLYSQEAPFTMKCINFIIIFDSGAVYLPGASDAGNIELEQ